MTATLVPETEARPVEDPAVPEASATVLPDRPEGTLSSADRRPVGGMSKDDLRALFGAGISSVSATLLLFGRIAPLEGRIGMVVVGVLMFVAIYALLVALDNDRPAVVDKVMTVLLGAAAVLAVSALVSVVIFVLYRGGSALLKPNLYVNDMSVTLPTDPVTSGGIYHAIVGTLIIIGIALLLTVPLGIACAVYLNESGGRMAELVRTVVTAMTALPSILAGLFILSTWILTLGQPRSGFAAALAVSIMILPIIIRSADLVLRLVPAGLREAAAATGAPRWRTVWHVVLPTARSGLANAVILGVARGVGETAPVLLVSGITANTNYNPFANPMMSLPLATFDFVRLPNEAQIQRGFATAAVLMVLVLVLFTMARVFAGRPAGSQSARQARRRAAASLRDLERMTGGPVAVPTSDTEVAT